LELSLLLIDVSITMVTVELRTFNEEQWNLYVDRCLDQICPPEGLDTVRDLFASKWNKILWKKGEPAKARLLNVS